jgi:protoheme IX farnesyltransferase
MNCRTNNAADVAAQHALGGQGEIPRSALDHPVQGCARNDKPRQWLVRLADYWTLTKPEVNFLVLVSTLLGFYLASRATPDFWRLLHTLLGTLLVASGTGTLNQYLERHSDKHMRRTANRPLPAGRLAPAEALGFGILLAALGGWELWAFTNPLTSQLALLTLGAYLLFYTPLKKRTPLCTLVGAFPGAMPPLIGWAAVRNHLSLDAWVLYLILFLWQFPHLLAIAWMYREDYARAGIQMLPRNDRQGRATMRQILAYSLVLIPASLLPAFLGQAGKAYLVGALVLGLGFLHYGMRLAFHRSNSLARRLVLASVVYLPLVFGMLMADKTPL